MLTGTLSMKNVIKIANRINVTRLSSSFWADVELIFSSILSLLLLKAITIFHEQKHRTVNGMTTIVAITTASNDILPLPITAALQQKYDSGRNIYLDHPAMGATASMNESNQAKMINTNGCLVKMFASECFTITKYRLMPISVKVSKNVPTKVTFVKPLS